jgi:hypothetical protein
MANLFKAQELKNKSRERLRTFSTGDYYATLNTKAKNILKENYTSFNRFKDYDIFLSHSIDDEELILEMVNTFEEKYKLSVFVDWIESPIARSEVTQERAAMIRNAIKSSKCLIYALTENSRASSWVQWEIGYADGITKRIAILPIEEDTLKDNEFYKQEYLGLYPYIDKGDYSIWINGPRTFSTVDKWVGGDNSIY